MDDVVEAACELLNLQMFSSTSETRGCGLEGRLLDRTWKDVAAISVAEREKEGKILKV